MGFFSFFLLFAERTAKKEEKPDVASVLPTQTVDSRRVQWCQSEAALAYAQMWG